MSPSRTTGARDLDRVPLRIVRGTASPEEIAALTVVLAAFQARAAEDETAAAPAARADSAAIRGRWNDPAWRLRRPLLAGVGGWRSAL